MLNAFRMQMKLRRVFPRVVMAHHFHKAAITSTGLLDDYDTVIWFFLGAHSRQANSQQFSSSLREYCGSPVYKHPGNNWFANDGSPFCASSCRNLVKMAQPARKACPSVFSSNARPGSASSC